MIKEAIEIEKRPSSFNGEDGWKISDLQKSRIYKMKWTEQWTQTTKKKNNKSSRNHSNKHEH